MKLQAHILFNGNLRSHKSNEQKIAAISSLLEKKKDLLKGKPEPLLEVEGETIWCSSTSEVEGTPEALRSLGEELFTILNKEVDITLDVYQVQEEKGHLFRFKRSGISTEQY